MSKTLAYKDKRKYFIVKKPCTAQTLFFETGFFFQNVHNVFRATQIHRTRCLYYMGFW